MSSIYSRKSSGRYLFAGVALLIAGCAVNQPRPELYDVVELVDVPFFPQTDYDCGPAALATILNAEGVAVSADDLIDAVYIEGLQGSLQVELLAATRRYGLLPVPVSADPRDLLSEVAAGRPVLVMQNLRFARLPRWHYAVVVGYSADDERFILRSGEEARRTERTSRFLRSWRLADHWGFVAVPPGEIPVSATADVYMRAVVGAAGQLTPAGAESAYSAAIERWPADPSVLFLSATRFHQLGNPDRAAELYQQLLVIDPEQAAARNNLANIYLERGCFEDAAREASLALALEMPDGSFREAIEQTISEIEAAARAGAGACRA